jgi:peptide deformylase
MTIQSVVKMGNPQLASPSVNVKEFKTNALKQILEDMRDTMQAEGGVGIAAPQIGHNIRVIMFGFEANSRYPDEKSIPFTILINPTIEILSDELVEGWEGCLSVPGLRGLVPRYQRIRYEGYNEFGEHVSRVAEGFHARVVQHEYDHLDGILYPRRIRDLKAFGFEDELKNII